MNSLDQVNQWIDILYNSSHYFNLVEYLTNKQINLLWAKPPKFNTENKELEKFYNNIFNHTQLWSQFQLNERVLAQYGMSIPMFGRTGKDIKNAKSYYITICNPVFFSRVSKIGEEEGSATLYYQYVADDTTGIVQDSYTKKKIKRSIYGGNKESITVGFAHGKIPNDMQLTRQFNIRNELGVLPFVQMVNRSYKDWRLLNNWNYYPSWLPVYKLQYALDAVFENVIWENEASKTRMYGNFSPAEMTDLRLNSDFSDEFLNNMFIKARSISNGGDLPDNGPTIIGGSPQFEAYGFLIDKYINLATKGWFMSPDNNVSSRKTETEMIYQAQDDIATATQLGAMRQNQWSRFLDKLFISAGFMKEGDIRPYSFELQPNLIFDIKQQTETLIEQINNGLITREKALSKLHGVDDASAKKMNEQIESSAKTDYFFNLATRKLEYRGVKNREEDNDAQDSD